MGIVTLIAGFLQGIFGPIMRWAERKQEMAAARDAAQSALDLEALRNQGIEAKYESQGAMSRLQATGAVFKYIMVGMWFYPWVMVQFSQTQALKIFTNMGLLPPFYSESCVMIMFAILGIPVGAKMASTVFDSVTGYFNNKRDMAYGHEQAVAKINRDAVLASVQKDLGGVMDEKTRELIMRGLDAGEQQQVATALGINNG